MSADDIWPAAVSPGDRSLWTAQIFPVFPASALSANDQNSTVLRWMVLWIQYCGALLELHLPTAARASTLGSGVALVPGGGDLEGRLEACSAVEPSLVPLGSVTVSAVELREALEAWRGARRVSLSLIHI